MTQSLLNSMSFKSREDFSLVNRAEQRVTEPGEFELMVGGSSRDCDLLRVRFEIK